MAKDISPHEKHKERMRKRFVSSNDFSGFAEHEILELLLNYCIIRGNTNDIAHMLIKKFGSVDNVLRADLDELTSVKGVGERTATFLKMQYSLLRYYNSQSAEKEPRRPGDIKEIAVKRLIPLFSKLSKEKMYAVFITGSNNIKSIKCMGEGESSTVYINPRDIMVEALKENIDAIILAHNHPAGVLVPSDADLQFTKSIETLLIPLRIQLVEHYIIFENKYYGIKKNTSLSYKIR